MREHRDERDEESDLCRALFVHICYSMGCASDTMKSRKLTRPLCTE